MDAAINAAFGKLWNVGGVKIPCRYRYQDGKHAIKTTVSAAAILDKGTECTDPDGVVFEVVKSSRVMTTTYEHILQPLNTKPETDWTPKR